MECYFYFGKRNRGHSPKWKITHTPTHINKSHRLSWVLNDKMKMLSISDLVKLSRSNDSFKGAAELKELNVQKHISSFQTVIIAPLVKWIRNALLAVSNVTNKNGLVFNAAYKSILLEVFRNIYQTEPIYSVLLIGLCFETVIHFYNKSCFTSDIEMYDKGILEARRFYEHNLCWQKENEEGDEEVVLANEEEGETLNVIKEIEASLFISKSHLMAIHNYHKDTLHYYQISIFHSIVLTVTTSLVYSAVAT